MNTADRIGLAAALVRLAELIETGAPDRHPELIATAARLAPPDPIGGGSGELERARRLAHRILRPAAAAVLRQALQPAPPRSPHPAADLPAHEAAALLRRLDPDVAGDFPAPTRSVAPDPVHAASPPPSDVASYTAAAPPGPTGSLHGRLAPQRGRATVLLLDTAGRRVAAADTAPDGDFELPGLTPGTYCLVTTASPPQARWVRVTAGTTLHVALDEPARLHPAPPREDLP